MKGAGGEDEQPVEEDVEQAESDVQDAGDVHVAAAAQHAGTKRVEHREGQAHGEKHEVEARVVSDVLASAKPVGQVAADADADATEHQGKQYAGYEALPQHLTRSLEVAGAYPMCHLNVESDTDRRTQAAEEPDAGADQADARTCRGPEAAHHAGVDILHHDVHQLCHHAGEAEQGGKLDL